MSKDVEGATVSKDVEGANVASAERTPGRMLSAVPQLPQGVRVDPLVNGRRGVGGERISVVVCDEREILRAGLVALLAEDAALTVTASAPGQTIAYGTDVAIVSGRVARYARFACPIVIVSEEPPAVIGAVAGNAVAGVLQRGSLTVAQLRATVRAAATGLRVEAQREQRLHAALDPRAVRVLELIAGGCSTREIATLMSYSERTIKNVINELHDQLQARTRAQAVAHAMRRGLI